MREEKRHSRYEITTVEIIPNRSINASRYYSSNRIKLTIVQEVISHMNRMSQRSCSVCIPPNPCCCYLPICYDFCTYPFSSDLFSASTPVLHPSPPCQPPWTFSCPPNSSASAVSPQCRCPCDKRYFIPYCCYCNLPIDPTRCMDLPENIARKVIGSVLKICNCHKHNGLQDDCSICRHWFGQYYSLCSCCGSIELYNPDNVRLSECKCSP